MAKQLAQLQEALYAEGSAGGQRAVLVVLQGMDTSGKGGVIRHVAGLVDPQGVHLAAFKAPTAAERRHDFLWRIRREVPRPGMIGVFDRSHYEDVLIARVDELVPQATWRARFDEINAFERELVDSGVTLVKCFLHISPDTQAKRLRKRLDKPEKRWKFTPSDIDARSKWPAYEQAYADVLRHCNTELAPWFVVPADHKWYRNWAIGELLRETLSELAPQFPPPDYRVKVARKRLAASDPLG